MLHPRLTNCNKAPAGHGMHVTCALFHWKIDLASSEALVPDVGFTNVFPVKIRNGRVYTEF